MKSTPPRPSSRRAALRCAACLILLAGPAAAQPAKDKPLLAEPGRQWDAKIPTLQSVTGHDWGEEITSYEDLQRYLQALAAAASDRVQLADYGRTYEGRRLSYLIITSPEQQRRWQPIRDANLELANPEVTSEQQARALIEKAPALVWLAHSIHGNETSSTEAALLTAYHLAADRSPQTRSLLQQLVVLIDPLQNPDGRERFVNAYREARGEFPQTHPLARERTERWPGGRSNHYLFDMNRDWFLQSQSETRQKVAAYLQWQPQIYIDAHEMGYNSTYYFVPPADPVNPFLLPRQTDWLFQLGRRQADWFDRYGFPYTTREMFDAFYPGYGSEWPTLQGGLGVLWEQAGVRGLAVDRDDETQLQLSDAIRHHYVSSLAALELAAEQRAALLWDFYQARARGIQLGREGPIGHYFLPTEPRPCRAAQLASLLRRNGVQVGRLTAPVTTVCSDIATETEKQRTAPAGSWHVSVAQPAGRLVRALLDRHVPMDEQFVQRQLQRNAQRFPDEIYDVTAWSLPLAFDTPCWAAPPAAAIPSAPWRDGEYPAGEVNGPQAKVAYLTPGGDGAIRALASWLQKGLRVHVADRELRMDEIDFPRGTLILRVPENPDSLHETMRQSARQFQLNIHAANSGFVTRGAHLGGPYVQWVRPPKIVLLMDEPTRYSAGHTWHLFDQVLRYPTTRIAARQLSRFDLDEHNVLIMPDGDYSGDAAPHENDVQRIKQWVREGGTLILVKGAAAWGAGDKARLLDTTLRKKPAVPDSPAAAMTKDGKPAAPGDSDASPPPDPVPGAFLRAAVFQEHWITFGCSETLDVLLNSNVILAPQPPAKLRSLVTFLKKDDLLVSGFCWPETLQLIAETPYVVHQPLGEGHVAAFTDDPAYRAMYPSLQRLLINAVMFGPGH